MGARLALFMNPMNDRLCRSAATCLPVVSRLLAIVDSIAECMSGSILLICLGVFRRLGPRTLSVLTSYLLIMILTRDCGRLLF